MLQRTKTIVKEINLLIEHIEREITQLKNS